MMRFTNIILACLPFISTGFTCTDKTTANDVLQGKNLSSQVYVITGGDSGIGYATALALAAKNATLLLGARDPSGKGAAAAANISRITGNLKVRVEKLDLANFDSVRQFANVVRLGAPQIDMLLCNAGIDHSPSTQPVTTDGFDMTFQVNFLGHFLLVESLLPNLRSSGGRIVHVSSEASTSPCPWGNMPNNCTDAASLVSDSHWTFKGENMMRSVASNYGLTKWLQIFHAAELARKESNLTAFSLHPGLVKSAMTEGLPPGTLKLWCGGDLTNCPLTAEEGAATQAYVATASNAVLRPYNGAYFKHCQAADSVRTNMIREHGEAAVITYQEQIYAFATAATKSNAVVYA